MKPTLVIVGRPNVGKSTLFNRITRSRDALVADMPGLTRDRHYGQGRLGTKPFIVVDTGGFEPVAKEGILSEMARQAREAIAEADVIVFLVDGRAGLAPQDKRIAHAVVFGALGALIGGAVARGGDNGLLPQTPAILIGAALGAIAGYITAGKSGDN